MRVHATVSKGRNGVGSVERGWDHSEMESVSAETRTTARIERETIHEQERQGCKPKRGYDGHMRRQRGSRWENQMVCAKTGYNILTCSKPASNT